MATIEFGPESNYATQSPGAQGPLLRRPLFPIIRWGAAWAGVAVGLSMQLALTLLGIASGLSAIDVNQTGNVSATGPLLWAGLSTLISAFVGGYVAARMSGLKRKVDGVLHGAVTWAVTTLLFAVLASSVSGSLFSGIFNTVAPAATHGSAASGDPAVGALLRGQIGGNPDAATLQRLQQDIEAGRREDAIGRMTGALGVERSRAATIVDQALIITGSPERASAQGRADANRAVETAGTAAWVVFLAVALSLAAGIGGGMLGAVGARRTIWATSTTTSGIPA